MNKYEKVTAYQERPDKEYVLCEADMELLRFGSNGKTAWTIHPQNGAHLLEGVELSNRLLAAKFDRPDVPYKSMKTEGIEQINGKDCYKVVKTREKGPERTDYYDKKSFLIVKIVKISNDDPQRNNKYEIYYEDYKKINGILFPYKEIHFSNGQRQEEITTEKIELNIEMPEGIFDIPEEVKAIMDKK